MLTTFFMLNNLLRTEAALRLESVGFRCTLKDEAGCLLVVQHDPRDEQQVYEMVLGMDRHTDTGTKPP